MTTKDNTVASVWWEELLYQCTKAPVSNLFVEAPEFDGKGFEMIAYIDKYFNPSGAMDSNQCIFELIDIKQENQTRKRLV